MAKHSTEKNGSMAGKLKIHGGFKAMDQKLASEKKAPRKK
jgi:hypothetical protein